MITCGNFTLKMLRVTQNLEKGANIILQYFGIDNLFDNTDPRSELVSAHFDILHHFD